MKKYDILIVTNNSEKYIENCIKNLENQTYNDFNIIIIDELSSDNTVNIIEKYMKIYNNLFLYSTTISDKEKSINIAINKVSSKYFIFVDPKDIVKSYFIEHLDNYINTQELDLISFNFKSYKDINNLDKFTTSDKTTFKVCNGRQALFLFSQNISQFYFYEHKGYVYNSNFIKQNNLKNDDLSFIPSILLIANNVLSIDTLDYFYNSDYYKNIVQNLKDNNCLDVYLKISDIYSKFGFSKEEVEKLSFNLILAVLHVSTFIKTDKEFNMYINILKNMYTILPNIGKEKKLHRFIIKHFPILPVIYYLSFTYFGDYSFKNIILKRFFTWIREITYREFREIINFSKYTTFRKKRHNIFWSSLLKSIKVLDKNKIFLDYLELPITTNCTLNCKGCANLIPEYKCRKANYNIDMDYLLSEIEATFKCIDGVACFRILGGEPFLHPNLDKIISVLSKKRQINSIIVVTNATILPNKNKLIRALKNKKVSIYISNYGKYSYNRNKLIDLCNRKKIKWDISTFNVSSSDYYWLDFGKPLIYEQNLEKLHKQFNDCPRYTKTPNILNGRLYLCSHSAYGDDLGIIKSNPSDYVDIMNKKNDNKYIRNKIYNLIYSKKYINSCKYCYIGTNKAKKIKVAEQLGGKNEKQI